MAISCIPLAPQQSPWRVGGNSIHGITVLGALIHIWRPEIADGCDFSCLLIWQGDIFISQHPGARFYVDLNFQLFCVDTEEHGFLIKW